MTIAIHGTVEVAEETPVATLRAARALAVQCGMVRTTVYSAPGSGYVFEGADDKETVFARFLVLVAFTKRPGVFTALVDGAPCAVRAVGPVFVSIAGAA